MTRETDAQKTESTSLSGAVKTRATSLSGAKRTRSTSTAAARKTGSTSEIGRQGRRNQGGKGGWSPPGRNFRGAEPPSYCADYLVKIAIGRLL